MVDDAAKKAAAAERAARKTRLSKLSLTEVFSPTSGLSADECREAVGYNTKDILIDWLCTAETKEVLDCERSGGEP
jgi:hypothetical protein